MKRIGYLGPKGTFSDTACQEYCASRSGFEPVALPTIDSLYEALKGDDVQSVIVPVENSIEGPVNLSFDRLVQMPDNYSITADIILPISHYMLGLECVPLSKITDIYSHYQALAQCQEFIKRQCPHAATHVVPSTAKAAELISSGALTFTDNREHHVAVIGQQSLAAAYDLVTLSQTPINDVKGNFTRFYVISDDTSGVNYGHTFIVVGAKKDQPGSLYSILGEFASRQINLTRILSRPTKQELGEYLFFIECEGAPSDPLVKEALDGVKKKAGFYRWLGSYSKGGDHA